MISLKNDSFSYDGQENNGLHNVSLEIPKGQCVLLCGESGCGKTTTGAATGPLRWISPMR